LKIRATGTSQLIVRAMGAAPVAMSQGETYDALKKNIVDGTLVPIEALEGFKQGEVLKYTTLNYSSLFSGVFRRHEPQEMEQPSAGPPENHHRCEQEIRRHHGQGVGGQ
jgi:hypothetical protein